MDQDAARLLFDRAGKLLIRCQPSSGPGSSFGTGAEFGIDFAEWTIGPDFMGIKFIPPGLHFFHYRFTNTANQGNHNNNSNHAFRNGFFFWIAESQTLVFEWSPSSEELIPEQRLDQDHVARLKHNIREFDRHLGTYPLDSPASTHSWPRLTRHITPQLLNRILPTHQLASGIHPLTATMESTLSDPHTHIYAAPSPDPSASALTFSPPAPLRIQFTAFDLKRSWDPTAHGQHPDQVTRHSLDKSWLLLQTINRAGGAQAFLGEFQLAFVFLLVGHNYEGFEQWKRIMHLVCQSREAVVNQSQVFVDALDAIHDQLAECPKDFFIDLLSSGNFVYHLLSQLMRTILNPDANKPPRPPELVQAMRRVSELCHGRFGMELQAQEPGEWRARDGKDDDDDDDDDDDEDRPVVVDLGEGWAL